MRRDHWDQLDDEQREDLKNRLHTARKAALEALGPAHTVALRVRGQEVEACVLSDARQTLQEHLGYLWTTLVEDEEWVLRRVGSVTLESTRLIPKEGGPRLKDAVEAFLRFTDKPMIAARAAARQLGLDLVPCSTRNCERPIPATPMSTLSRYFVPAPPDSRIGLWKPSFRTRKHSLPSCRSAGWSPDPQPRRAHRRQGRCRPRGRGGLRLRVPRADGPAFRPPLCPHLLHRRPFPGGLLHPLPHEQSQALAKTWVAYGIKVSPLENRRPRMEGLLDSIKKTIPTVRCFRERSSMSRAWSRFVSAQYPQTTWSQSPADSMCCRTASTRT